MVYFDKHLYKKPAWLPLLAASFLLLASAEASPLRVTGDFSTTYEKDSYSDQPTISGLTNTLRLQFEKDLSPNWSAYARLGCEYTSQPALADFNTANDAYGPERQAVAALDQFGLIYKTPNLTCKIGRQEASIGKTELLYSRPATYIGRTYFVDGVTAAASAGKWEFDFVAAREDNPGRQTNKLYALRTGYHPAPGVNYGCTLAQYQYSNGERTRHWAVDAAWQLGKNTFSAEYTQANAVSDNKALAASWAYDVDDKNTLCLTTFHVEQNGDMGKQTGFDNDCRGVYYGLTRKITARDSLDILYANQTYLSTGQKKRKLVATISHTF